MKLELPTLVSRDPESLVDCIAYRRSYREFSEAALSINALSLLLWSAQGITGQDGKRATPSAGGLYPLHLRILVQRVESLEPGVYDYTPDAHSLERVGGHVTEGVVRELGIGDQPWLEEAALVIGVTVELEATIKHFESQPPNGERGVRYAYMEAGALTQNVHLQSTALGVGCVLVAGFDDSRAKKVLRLPSGLEPAALLCIGIRKK
ncbi:SagB/ThcOx family dehydrogenase [Halomonas salipaludis]|nr:SagB/ThcOx family dehydrogenase [Halomonas salipaludis]